MATELIEVDQVVASALRAQAANRKLPLAEFLKEIAASQDSANETLPLSEQDWNRTFDEGSGHFPVLPDGFNRADIYFDHRLTRLAIAS